MMKQDGGKRDNSGEPAGARAVTLPQLEQNIMSKVTKNRTKQEPTEVLPVTDAIEEEAKREIEAEPPTGKNKLPKHQLSMEDYVGIIQDREQRGLSEEMPAGPEATITGPGAVHEGGSEVDIESEVGPDFSNGDLEATNHDARSSSLVEARPVAGESIIVQEAREVQQDQKRPCPWCMRLAWLEALVVACVVVAVVSVGVVFGTKKKEPTSESTTTLSSTSAPSGALDSLLCSLNLSEYTLESLQDPSSAQSQAYQWLREHQNITNLPQWRKRQLFAITTFYYSFEGPHWTDKFKRDWLDDTTHECSWMKPDLDYFISTSRDYHGRTDLNFTPCNENMEIQSIAMAFLDLSKSTPSVPPEIVLLPSLSILSLPLNGIHAPLTQLLPPSVLDQLSNMDLINYHANQLTGSIPPQIARLTSMKTLVLIDNQISGTIPSQMGSMSNLELLGLGLNSLTGTIPKELSLLSSVWVFLLYDNLLEGTIPSELSLLSNVMLAYLYSNHLVGTIPTEIGQLPKLWWLFLQDNQLSGPIPSQLGSIASLNQLYLLQNNFSSAIPSDLGLLTGLTEMSFSQNPFLKGTIPNQLGSLFSQMKWLDLSNLPLLEGPIPFSADANYSDAKYFSFAESSQLSGSIPQGLCFLQHNNDVNNASCSHYVDGLAALTQSCRLDFDCSEILCGCDCPC